MGSAMRHQLPPLNALKTFECAARHLNMSAAAAELGVSQSAVSQQVRTLEEWLFTDLFLRERGRITLTAPGAQLSDLLERGFTELADLCHSISHSATATRLRLRTEPAFGAKWLRRRLRPLGQHLGRVEMEMRTDHAMPAKFPEEADVLIHYGTPPDWPHVATFPLIQLHGFPACAPDLLAETGPLEKPADIARYHLLHGEDRSNWRDWLAKNDVTSVSHMGGTLYYDFGLTIEAAVEGEGALIADPVLCERELADGLLVPLSPTTVFCASYFLAIKESALQSARMCKLRDWLLAEAANATSA